MSIMSPPKKKRPKMKLLNVPSATTDNIQEVSDSEMSCKDDDAPKRGGTPTMSSEKWNHGKLLAQTPNCKSGSRKMYLNKQGYYDYDWQFEADNLWKKGSNHEHLYNAVDLLKRAKRLKDD